MIQSNLSLATTLLTQALALHRDNIRRNGDMNYLAARFAAEAALLLELKELLVGFRAILKKAESAVSDPFGRALFSVRDRQAVLASYPELTDAYFDVYPLNRYADFASAFATAASPLDKEEVLLTQAVHGQIDEAVAASVKLTEPHRRWNVVFVAAIEAFRRGDVARGTALYNSLPAETLGDWGLPQFALGIVGHVPWLPYPYPDY